MARYDWKQVSRGVHRACEWTFEVVAGRFFLSGPSWYVPSQVEGFASFVDVEEEILEEIRERRAVLRELIIMSTKHGAGDSSEYEHGNTTS